MSADLSERVRHGLERINGGAELAIDMLERHGDKLTPIRRNAVLGDLKRIRGEARALLTEEEQGE